MRNDLICPYFRREQPSFDGDLTTIAGKRFRSDGTALAVFCLTWAVLTAFSLLVSLCGTVTIGGIPLSFPPEKQGAGIIASAIGFPFFLWLSLTLFHQSTRIVAVTNSHGLYLSCGIFPWEEMRKIDFKIGTQYNRYAKEPNAVILIGKDYRVVLVNLPQALLKEARKHKPNLTLTIVSAATGKRNPLG